MTQRYQGVESDLRDGRTIILDGATGTELERRGARMHAKAWCAMATLSHPDLLGQVHMDYIRAGARLVTANTFSTTRNLLAPSGLDEYFETLIRRSVAIAQTARQACDADQRVLIAGSMSHQIPVLPGADQRDQNAVPDRSVAARNFAEQAELLAECGVDLLLMEMMSDPDLANAAIAAARATGLPVWVGLSVRAGPERAPVSYALPHLDIDTLLDRIDLSGATVTGIMHSNVDLIEPSLQALRKRWTGPMMAYPDSGYFEMPNWQFVDIIEPDQLARQSEVWARLGARVLGGCCGLGVAHIEALATAHRA